MTLRLLPSDRFLYWCQRADECAVQLARARSAGASQDLLRDLEADEAMARTIATRWRTRPTTPGHVR